MRETPWEARRDEGHLLPKIDELRCWKMRYLDRYEYELYEPLETYFEKDIAWSTVGVLRGARRTMADAREVRGERIGFKSGILSRDPK
ncbi:hypothetical protein KM043_000762 [Ampulex compressa]|nr:hypothetical protein KM043_000762 [Ampulex compressa]